MPSPADGSGAELPPAGWSEVGEWLDRGERLYARYRVARWALETLQAQLGDDWLERAVTASDGGFPLNLDLLGAHTHALVEALEWALRLEMCR